jgi:membrane protein
MPVRTSRRQASARGAVSAPRKAPVHGETNPLRRGWNVLRGTVSAFIEDDVPRKGAALAYYTTFAVAPMLLLTLLVAGKFFEDAGMRERVIGQISRLAGAQLGEAVEAVGTTAESKAEGALTLASLATLAFGALAVFRHLQDALNQIWKVENPPDLTWRKKLQRRLSSFGTVAMTGFLLQVSLVASAGLTWLADHAARQLAWPSLIMEVCNYIFTLTVISFLFALVFRLLPDVSIRWRDVWLGALLTAVAFAIGKAGLALYLSRAHVSSTYGVAGSIIILLLWSYYAAQIVFLGAEFTRVWKLSQRGRRPFNPKSPLPRELIE